MYCPQCNSEMCSGYFSANSPLNWIDHSKFNSYVFKSDDLAKSGLKSIFPWKGYYFQAFNCFTCKLVFVDYSKKYDRNTIESMRIQRSIQEELDQSTQELQEKDAEIERLKALLSQQSH